MLWFTCALVPPLLNSTKFAREAIYRAQIQITTINVLLHLSAALVLKSVDLPIYVM